ncbi:MAG: nucleotide exchange factor GrpE [Thermodesulfobacteriota bacterium]|jgi:molecular chaperone GrpE|nr:MAG: nucleotide exchange factor GrpE [Thermodesulfobacteriota bacterium]
MDEGKKIKMHFTSDKEKEAKAKKEKGQEQLESQDVHKKEETAEALPPETSDERKNQDLASLLKVKEEELQKEHDRLLRTLAEHENYKKRMARERADFLKFGNEALLKELLPVLDNLELSLEHARNATNAHAITEGIELVIKEFLSKLKKFGLSAVSARGEKFDPNQHEAAAQIETTEHPEDTVVDEFQKGYFFHDRLLRPARVSVAKSPHIQEE